MGRGYLRFALGVMGQGEPWGSRGRDSQSSWDLELEQASSRKAFSLFTQRRICRLYFSHV